MARYKIDDTVVDTDLAQQEWEEATRWDGKNHISRATHSQWEHETLYRSAKGRYYVVSQSQIQGSTSSAAWLDQEEAARWLLSQDHDLPEDLAALATEVME